LLKNKAIQMLFEVDKLKQAVIREKDFLEKIMQSDVYFSVKEAILNQLKNEKWEDKRVFYFSFRN
jgi:aminopeptidase N